MKKKYSWLVAGLSVVPALAFAAQEGPGCGLGQQVWEGKTGIMAHTSAATTNGIFANQIFGMSTGTLGCNPESVVFNEYERDVFVAANYDNIARDAAQGSGEHLASLAELMGIAEADREAFYSFAQANYDSLFNEQNDGYREVVAALDQAMMGDARLAQYGK